MNSSIKLETFSVTFQLTETLDRWNRTDSIRLKAGARGLGLIGIPFTGLFDSFIHTGLFAVKALTGVVITPLNIFLNKKELIDFEWASALAHLIKATQGIFQAAILPFIALLDPSKAFSQFESPISAEKFPTTGKNENKFEKDEHKEKIQPESKDKNDQVEGQISLSGHKVKPNSVPLAPPPPSTKCQGKANTSENSAAAKLTSLEKPLPKKTATDKTQPPKNLNSELKQKVRERREKIKE